MSLAWLLNVCFPVVSAWEDSGRFVLSCFVVVLITKYGEEGFFLLLFCICSSSWLGEARVGRNVSRVERVWRRRGRLSPLGLGWGCFLFSLQLCSYCNPTILLLPWEAHRT